MIKKLYKLKWQIIGIVIFAILIGLFMYRYGHFVLTLAKSPEAFRKWIKGFDNKGFIAYIGIQIIQVVIFVIPGEIVQVAGGYIYGIFLGSLLSVIGITIGSLICFEIARLLGYTALKKIISPAKLSEFNDFINNPKGEIALFLLFLIPAMPKDILSYVAGVTPISFYKYFVITLLARLPGIVFSAYIGANIFSRNYFVVAIVLILAIILFVIGILKKDLIMKKINRTNR